MAKRIQQKLSTELRLEEIEKELLNFPKKRKFLSHWNLEKDLIKSIRSSKEEIENLNRSFDKYEEKGILQKLRR
ncbi:MAG: hypothetical protein R3A12_08150 [Ignavibacteria bacterium]